MSLCRYVGDSESGWYCIRPCPRCDGRGYHWGFGEHGHDPDWCDVCGGPGTVSAEILTAPDT